MQVRWQRDERECTNPLEKIPYYDRYPQEKITSKEELQRTNVFSACTLLSEYLVPTHVLCRCSMWYSYPNLASMFDRVYCIAVRRRQYVTTRSTLSSTVRSILSLRGNVRSYPSSAYLLLCTVQKINCTIIFPYRIENTERSTLYTYRKIFGSYLISILIV